MYLYLALLMQIALSIETTKQTGEFVEVELKNNSQKTITAFRLQTTESMIRSRDLRNTKGIEPGALYNIQVQNDGQLNLEVLGVVFSDNTTEGPGASVLLAVREGVRQAEEQTVRQVKKFLESNEDVNDITALSKELEVPLALPSKWTTEEEKLAWRDGYNGTRRMARQKLSEIKPDHRRKQLEAIGGAR